MENCNEDNNYLKVLVKVVEPINSNDGEIRCSSCRLGVSSELAREFLVNFFLPITSEVGSVVVMSILTTTLRAIPSYSLYNIDYNNQ